LPTAKLKHDTMLKY